MFLILNVPGFINVKWSYRLYQAAKCQVSKCLVLFRIQFTSLVWFTKAICVLIKIHHVSFHVLYFNFKNGTSSVRFKLSVFVSLALIKSFVTKTQHFVILWGESSFANTPGSKHVKSYTNCKASGSRRYLCRRKQWRYELIKSEWTNEGVLNTQHSFTKVGCSVSPLQLACVCKQQLGPPLWLD